MSNGGWSEQETYRQSVQDTLAAILYEVRATNGRVRAAERAIDVLKALVTVGGFVLSALVYWALSQVKWPVP